MPPTELLCVGEAFEDLVFVGLPRLPRPGEELKTDRFSRTVGGGAVITAVAARRLGLRSAVLSALGPSAAAFLRREGLSFRNLRRKDELHAVTVALSTSRERSFVTFNGVNSVLESRLLGALAGARCRHLHFAFPPGRAARWAKVAEGCRRRGISTSWDFGWNPALRRDPGFPRLLLSLDYVLLNDLECRLYAGEKTLAASLRHWRRGARQVVIKRGARGALWLAPGGDLKAPGRRVRPVDTTGAGDAFNGGFLFALLKGMAPERCLRVANAVGALSTRAAGGVDALPRWAEIA